MDHHEDEAPPPAYSTLDPVQSAQLQNAIHDASSENSHNNVNQVSDASSPQLETTFSSLSINEPPSSAVSDPSAVTPMSSAESTTLSRSSPITTSTQFASAERYFAERCPPVSISGDTKLEILVHHMTIYARSQGKDYPRRPRCWKSRRSEINQHDWDTFLNFLFPSHLGRAASSNALHAQVRAEIERDRKDRPQETDQERSARINAVIAEWNEKFFALRGVHITCTYVADLEEGPASSLCPNCYPQATEASRMRGRHARKASDESPIPFSPETPVKSALPQGPVPQTIHLPLQSPRVSSSGSTIAASNQTKKLSSKRSHKGDQSLAFWKSNPKSWASQMTSMAQQYAAKISNQAQDYGRSLEESALARSRQVELYSKKMEGNAIARARQLETYALTQGQRIEHASGRFTNWAVDRGKRTIRSSSNASSFDESDQSADEIPQHQQHQVPRRTSTASDVSIPSISSIDTVSSVSDLEPDDLTSFREQLAALNEYHSHELYDAALSLRNQLQVLKKTRLDSRFRSQRARRWGQWDSPAEAREQEQRRKAMKRETKLLREKFAEVEHRAKSEVREQKKARQERRRKQREEQLRSFIAPNPSQGLQRGFSSRGKRDMDFKFESPDSLNYTTSEPVHDLEKSSQDNTPMPPPPLKQSDTSSSMDPHEAAKAWTEAQRAKVKNIQKTNKERIKEIQKEYKEREKQQRKAIKKMNKQKHSLTRTTLGGSVSSSSTLILPETGTVRGVPPHESVIKPEVPELHNETVVQPQIAELHEDAVQPQIPELQGNVVHPVHPVHFEIPELDGRMIE